VNVANHVRCVSRVFAGGRFLDTHEAVCSSENLVPTHRTTQCHKADAHCLVNLKI
jgi:hypothetical protein